jgi:hypothetical protein
MLPHASDDCPLALPGPVVWSAWVVKHYLKANGTMWGQCAAFGQMTMQILDGTNGRTAPGAARVSRCVLDNPRYHHCGTCMEATGGTSADAEGRPASPHALPSSSTALAMNRPLGRGSSSSPAAARSSTSSSAHVHGLRAGPLWVSAAVPAWPWVRLRRRWRSRSSTQSCCGAGSGPSSARPSSSNAKLRAVLELHFSCASGQNASHLHAPGSTTRAVMRRDAAQAGCGQ